MSMVVFDCDSTLTAVEGIDELAAGHEAEVAAMTDAAMRGELPLEAVYGRRLSLIRPSRDQVQALGRRYVEMMVPDAAEVVGVLTAEGVEVRIMSGGLLPAVLILADALGVAASAVAAVEIRFDGSGAYNGFDAGSPLARSGGKNDLLNEWRRTSDGRIMMVGDGATDLEAAGAADRFVAYAGVVARAAVVAAADVAIHSASLAPVVPLALGGERPAAGPGRDLFDRGNEMLNQNSSG